jgi:hypothetical protein
MSSNDEIVVFFREVQRVIAKHGLRTVLKTLRSINNDDDGYTKDVTNYIVASTANKYGVTKEDILRSNKRGAITDARRMCFALMKEHLTLSDGYIGDHFGISRQYINRELGDLPINQDEFATKDEAKFVQDFLHLTTKVLFYKNNYSLKNIHQED